VPKGPFSWSRRGKKPSPIQTATCWRGLPLRPVWPIEKLQLIEQANALATHDGLTGLINHRQFQIMLKDEITRAIRYDDPLSLTLCDIDFFKKVNDTYGHQSVNVVLREISTKTQGKDA